MTVASDSQSKSRKLKKARRGKSNGVVDIDMSTLCLDEEEPLENKKKDSEKVENISVEKDKRLTNDKSKDKDNLRSEIKPDLSQSDDIRETENEKTSQVKSEKQETLNTDNANKKETKPVKEFSIFSKPNKKKPTQEPSPLKEAKKEFSIFAKPSKKKAKEEISPDKDSSKEAKTKSNKKQISNDKDEDDVVSIHITNAKPVKKVKAKETFRDADDDVVIMAETKAMNTQQIAALDKIKTDPHKKTCQSRLSFSATGMTVSKVETEEGKVDSSADSKDDFEVEEKVVKEKKKTRTKAKAHKEV